VRLKLLTTTLLLFLTVYLQSSSSHASNLEGTSADKLRILEILAMLEEDEFRSLRRIPPLGMVSTQEMIDVIEEANPKIRQRRIAIVELNELVKKEYSLEFLLSLTKKYHYGELNLNPVIVRIINEELSYSDELMLGFLNEIYALTAEKDKDTRNYCLSHQNYCYTALEAFINRGNVPQYIESFMLKSNYMNDLHLGKISSQMDHLIIEKEISELLFWASENNDHILNNRLESLAANSFLWKFHTIINDNPKMPNLGYSPYPEWCKNIDAAISDLRLIQAELQDY